MTGILDDVDIQVVGLPWLCHGDLHDNRAPGRHLVGVEVLFVLLSHQEVTVGLGEIAHGGPLPIRIAAMSRGGTASPDQPRVGVAVEHPGRERHIAGAPYRIAFADEHRHQHEQPQHHQRDPK
jgi:hypothetical protein